MSIKTLERSRGTKGGKAVSTARAGKKGTGGVKDKPVAGELSKERVEYLEAKLLEAEKIAPKHLKWLALSVLLDEEDKKKSSRKRAKSLRKRKSGSGSRKGGRTS